MCTFLVQTWLFKNEKQWLFCYRCFYHFKPGGQVLSFRLHTPAQSIQNKKLWAVDLLLFPLFCLVSVFWLVLPRPTPASLTLWKEELCICVRGARPTAALSTLTRKVGRLLQGELTLISLWSQTVPSHPSQDFPHPHIVTFSVPGYKTEPWVRVAP